MNHQTLYVVAAINEEDGLTNMKVYDAQVDSQRFVEIFQEITPKNSKVLLFMDQAPWHDSKFTKAFASQYGVEIAFNVAWQPYLNPIETVFALIRKKYNALRIDDLMAGHLTPPVELLNQAGHAIDGNHVKSII